MEIDSLFPTALESFSELLRSKATQVLLELAAYEIASGDPVEGAKRLRRIAHWLVPDSGADAVAAFQQELARQRRNNAKVAEVPAIQATIEALRAAFMANYDAKAAQARRAQCLRAKLTLMLEVLDPSQEPEAPVTAPEAEAKKTLVARALVATYN